MFTEKKFVYGKLQVFFIHIIVKLSFYISTYNDRIKYNDFFWTIHAEDNTVGT